MLAVPRGVSVYRGGGVNQYNIRRVGRIAPNLTKGLHQAPVIDNGMLLSPVPAVPFDDGVQGGSQFTAGLVFNPRIVSLRRRRCCRIYAGTRDRRDEKQTCYACEHLLRGKSRTTKLVTEYCHANSAKTTRKTVRVCKLQTFTGLPFGSLNFPANATAAPAVARDHVRD